MWYSDVPLAFRNEIVIGDARLLAEQLPNACVDLVFTDPVYENLEDYEWLAATAQRVLKPGKSLLAWCGNKGQYAVKEAMERYLTFVTPLTYVKIAKTYRLKAYRAFSWATPCLWFIKPGEGTLQDHRKHDWLIDTVLDVDSNCIVSTAPPPSGSYKWHKNPEAYERWLLALTKPGDVIWDPFTGSGSLPVLCKEQHRNFMASEILPEVGLKAQRRLANTQAMHPEFVEQARF